MPVTITRQVYRDHVILNHTPSGSVWVEYKGQPVAGAAPVAQAKGLVDGMLRITEDR